MHFWIDKPTGRYYGFSGRRYPAMSFPKTHLGQHRRCGSLDVARLQTVTPVHRFQTFNNGANFAGPSNSIRFPRQNHNNDSTQDSTRARSDSRPENTGNISNICNNQHALPESTTNNRGILNFSEISDAEMAGYRLRCSVWIIFVLATGFVAAARFYFDHQQGAGLEVLVFCGLLATVLMSGCFYSITCKRTQNNRQINQTEAIATVSIANANLSESTRPVSVPTRHNPPPPYHIAILIPPPVSSEEAPPPSYDKIILNT